MDAERLRLHGPRERSDRGDVEALDAQVLLDLRADLMDRRASLRVVIKHEIRSRRRAVPGAALDLEAAECGLADVLDGSAAPTEGEMVSCPRLGNVVRRCLREVAWLELVVVPRLLVHFGYDMRLVVASSIPLTSVLEEIQSSGLFVYDSDAVLLTINDWPP